MADVGALEPGQLRRTPHQQRLSLAPSLEEPQIQCANSLTLTTQDRCFWQFFPSTAVFALYDFGECSSLRYLYEVLAPSSSVAMSMVLAISASEMHKRGLHASQDGRDQSLDYGLRHYGAALEQLRSGLDRDPNTNMELGVEVLVASIFLMVNYDIHFSTPTSEERIKTHLAGLWALISTHPLFQSLPQDDPAPERQNERTAAAGISLSCQLILWAIYLDVSMTSSGASESLMRRLASSSNPLFEWRRLCATARRSNPLVWRERYSPQQRLRDMEIRRPTEFAFEVFAIRFAIWELGSNWRIGHGEEITATSLLHQLLYLEETYADILLVVDTAELVPWNQTIEILVRATLFYWATLLFYCRTIDGAGIEIESRQNTIAKLTYTLYVHYEREADKRRQARTVWPTFIAALETKDPIHRCWLLERLRECRMLTSECQRLCSVTEDILGNIRPPAAWTSTGHVVTQN